jgi:hypothetical protein
MSVHSPTEVVPARVSDLDVRRRDLAAILAEDVQKDEEVARPPVQDAVP